MWMYVSLCRYICGCQEARKSYPIPWRKSHVLFFLFRFLLLLPFSYRFCLFSAFSFSCTYSLTYIHSHFFLLFPRTCTFHFSSLAWLFSPSPLEEGLACRLSVCVCVSDKAQQIEYFPIFLSYIPIYLLFPSMPCLLADTQPFVVVLFITNYIHSHRHLSLFFLLLLSSIYV